MRKGSRKKARPGTADPSVAAAPEKEEFAEEDGSISAGETKIEDGDSQESQSGSGMLASGGRAPPGKGAGVKDGGISQYVFTFELIKQYPTVRAFIVKQPLKRSFNDTLAEFFGSNKKGAYRL